MECDLYQHTILICVRQNNVWSNLNPLNISLHKNILSLKLSFNSSMMASSLQWSLQWRWHRKNFKKKQWRAVLSNAHHNPLATSFILEPKQRYFYTKLLSQIWNDSCLCSSVIIKARSHDHIFRCLWQSSFS